MPRPLKNGLDYFPLDVRNDDNLELLEAEFGITGWAVIIKIWSKIYENGFYYKWTPEHQLLFSKRINVDINLINAVIDRCFERQMLDKTKFDKYKILTSDGVQRRYFSAIKRRKIECTHTEYLTENTKKLINEINNQDIADINSINVNNKYTKERKEKENKVKKRGKENQEEKTVFPPSPESFNYAPEKNGYEGFLKYISSEPGSAELEKYDLRFYYDSVIEKNPAYIQDYKALISEVRKYINADKKSDKYSVKFRKPKTTDELASEHISKNLRILRQLKKEGCTITTNGETANTISKYFELAPDPYGDSRFRTRVGTIVEKIWKEL